MIHQTTHARKLAPFLLGLEGQALQMHLQNVHNNGFIEKDTDGTLRKFIQKQLKISAKKKLATAHIRLWGCYLYLFKQDSNGPCLITIMNLPQSVKDQAQELMARNSNQ